MDIDRLAKEVAAANAKARTKCKTCLVEDCRREMEIVLIRKIASQLQSLYDDDLCNRYVALNKDAVEKAFNNFYDHVYDTRAAYLRHRRIGLDVYNLEYVLETFRKEERKKLCDELCTEVIARLLDFKMVVTGWVGDGRWCKIFDIKFCDEEFVLVRIRENYREEYPLILHELVKQVTQESEA